MEPKIRKKDELITTGDQLPAEHSFAVRKQDNQLLEWISKNKTPLDMVEIREGRGGKDFYYVRHQYITEKLNELTGWNWDYRIIREWIHEADDQVSVLGELTVRIGNHVIVKSQYGSHPIERYSSGPNTGKAISIGDALKSAASDALKKCVSLIGFGSDLSIPIQPDTRRELHAVGVEVFKDKWDEARHKAVYVITGGKSKSSNDLLDIQARILIAVMREDLHADVTKAFAKKLNPKKYQNL